MKFNDAVTVFALVATLIVGLAHMVSQGMEVEKQEAEITAEYGPCLELANQTYLCEEVICQIGSECVSRQGMNLTTIRVNGQNRLAVVAE